MQRLTLTILLLFIFIYTQQAFACMYFNKSFDPKQFSEKEREALMFHDGEYANLILKTSFQGKLPSELNWVLPLPSKPVFYKEAEPSLFTELRNYFNNGEGAGAAVGGFMVKGNMPRSPGIIVHKTVNLEGYKIIPIEITSTESGKDLNDFLSRKGFIGMPDEIQKPYLKKGAFFLAIEIKTPPVENNSKTEIKPLWIKYAANELRFPLKFTHDYRTFDFTLYIYTFEGVYNHFNTLLTQRSSWSGMGINLSHETPMPALKNLMSHVDKNIDANKKRFVKLHQKLDSAYQAYSKNQKKDLNFNSWIKAKSLYRFPLNGINTSLFTRDLKEDPGMKIP